MDNMVDGLGDLVGQIREATENIKSSDSRFDARLDGFEKSRLRNHNA